MSVKIAVGGPPHSGKTVLVGLLRSLLPRDKFVVIEAAPDGEGISGWSFEAAQEIVRVVRRKGKFLPEWVTWVVASVRASTMPITLVDLGGMLLDEDGAFSPLGKRLTPQNEAILGECTHLIVIANPKYVEAGVVDNWLAEAGRLGVGPLVILESVLEGTDEIYEDRPEAPLRARITHLEREAPPFESTAARAVAQRILSVAGTASHEDDGSAQADVNFPALAEELNIPVRNGGSDRDWAPGLLPKLLSVVSAQVAGQQEVRLWGNTPTGLPWYVLAAGLKAKVSFYDPKVPGYVELLNLEPQSEGSQLLEWRVEEWGGYSFVEFTIPGQVFDVKNLSQVFPPAVNPARGVILSGKGPRWLTGALVRAYARAGVRWVSVFSPQESARAVDGRSWSETNPGMGPAVVVASHDQTVPLGMVVAFRL